MTPPNPPPPRQPLRPEQRTYRGLLAGLVGATLGVPVLQHAVSMAVPWLADRQTAYSRALGEVVAPVAHGLAITAAMAGGFALFVMALGAVVSMEKPDADPRVALAPAKAGSAWCLALAALTGAVPLVAGFAAAPGGGVVDALMVVWPLLALAAAFRALRAWAEPRLLPER